MALLAYYYYYHHHHYYYCYYYYRYSISRLSMILQVNVVLQPVQ